MECVLQPPPIMSTFHDIMGENVPFDASVAMVTARVFLSRRGRMQMCSPSVSLGHPGCINADFLCRARMFPSPSPPAWVTANRSQGCCPQPPNQEPERQKPGSRRPAGVPMVQNCCGKVGHAHSLPAAHGSSFDLTARPPAQLSHRPDSCLEGDIDGLRAWWQSGRFLLHSCEGI